MLNCEDFRDRFEPRGEPAAELEAHRRSCADCATWAGRLEVFAGAEARVALPERLRERLLGIPLDENEPAVVCGDVRRLYEATWRKAWDDEVDPAVERHLDGCRRCRTIYGTLEASFRAPRHAMPRALVRRVRSFAERPRLPLFARDGRLAIAASAVLTASLMVLVGNPTSLFRATAETVSSRATVLAEAGETRSQAFWEDLTEGLERRYEKGRELLAERGRTYQEFWYEARSFYENEEWRELLASLTLEGDSDGEP